MDSKRRLVLACLVFIAFGCDEDPTVDKFYCSPEYGDPICQVNVPNVPDGGADSGD